MPDPRPYCPECEPEADCQLEMLEVTWCGDHIPRRDGLDDAGVDTTNYVSGTGESGGVDNRAWCALIHRGTR